MTSAIAAPALTVRAVRAIPVRVPLNFVLGTSLEIIREVNLVLIDVETEEGVTGRSYLFGYIAAVARAIVELSREVEAQTRGQKATPEAFWQRLTRRFALVGVQGVVRMAIAGFDGAMWDAAAQAAGVPLCRLLGAPPRPVRAYNSCGLGITADKGALAAEAETLLERGFGAIKLRLGYPALDDDIAAVRAVKARVGDGVLLMVDYNQVLALDDAMLRGRALDGEDIYWLEEPIRHDDYAGARKLRDALTVPVQIGENFNGTLGMEAALDAGAADYVMPDLERIGGVTGWRRAAAIAAQRKLPMSSHLFPEVSAHLMTATPTCHFLEYVDWADVLVEQPLEIKDGHAIVPQRAGNGMTWKQEAIARYRLT